MNRLQKERIRRIEQFYQRHAHGYESKFRLPFLRRIRQREEEQIRAFLLKYFDLQKQGHLMEWGCGSGIFTIFMAQAGFRIRAVDISPAMLEQLDAKLEANQISNVETDQSDVETIPVPTPKLRGLYAIGLLEYAKDPAALVGRIPQFIQPGGIAVLTAPTLSLAGFLYWLSSLFRKRLGMRLFSRRGFKRLFTQQHLQPIEIAEVGWRLPLFQPLTRIAAVKWEP